MNWNLWNNYYFTKDTYYNYYTYVGIIHIVNCLKIVKFTNMVICKSDTKTVDVFKNIFIKSIKT